jgi:hypothetical protein
MYRVRNTITMKQWARTVQYVSVESKSKSQRVKEWPTPTSFIFAGVSPVRMRFCKIFQPFLREFVGIECSIVVFVIFFGCLAFLGHCCMVGKPDYGETEPLNSDAVSVASEQGASTVVRGFPENALFGHRIFLRNV